jgi:hypothetical protein
MKQRQTRTWWHRSNRARELFVTVMLNYSEEFETHPIKYATCLAYTSCDSLGRLFSQMSAKITATSACLVPDYCLGM